MPLRPFDFADLPLEHAALRTVADRDDTRVRLRERAERGPVPSCAAAVLAERGDPWALATLSLLAPFLDRPDLEALAHSTATDAIACTAAAVNAPGPVRQTAVELIARLPPSPCAHAVLAELADRPRDPVAKAARGVASDMAMRLDKAARAESDRQRARGALVRTWTGIRRQELQREVATGSLAPCVAVVCGDPEFLAGLVPPIDDAVRPALVPALFAAARGADEQSRSRLFALFQGRFRDVAREPLSLLARFVALKGRDARVPALAVERLVAFGAWRDVVAAIVTGTNEVRSAALAAMQPSTTRTANDLDRELAREGADWLAHTGDASSAERLRAAFAR
jgi:hypothetical protein